MSAEHETRVLPQRRLACMTVHECCLNAADAFSAATVPSRTWTNVVVAACP